MVTVLETGRTTLTDTIDDTGEVDTINFSTSYNNPVAVAYIPTRGGGQSINFRIRNLSSNSMEVFMEEPDNQGHSTEEVVWMVAEEGEWTTNDGVSFEAKTHTTSTVRSNADGNNFGDSISYSSNFGSSPAVLHSLNTYNNGEFMATQANNIGSSTFNLSQEAAETGNESGATTEDIGWIAIEQFSTGDTINGNTFESAIVSDGSNDGVDDSPQTINFSANFGTAPDIIVSGASMEGSDGFWARGEGTWNSTTHDVFAEEDEVGDTERGHADEFFSYMAISPNATVDVTVLEPTLDTVFDNFEDGDTVEWSNPNGTNWGAQNDRSFSGSWSGAMEQANSPDYVLAQRSFGEGVDAVELFFQESSTSNGGAYQFLDDQGNRVAGAGTHNPQWIYTDGSSGVELYAGDGYDRWVRLLVEFDYQNETVVYTFEDGSSGTTRFASGQDMDNVGIVTQMQVVNINNPTELGTQSTSSNDYNQWTDYIHIRTGDFRPADPSNLTIDSTTQSQVDMSWTNNANILQGFNIYRDGSQYDTVGQGTTTYSDTTVTQGSTYDYQTSAFNGDGESGLSNQVTTTIPSEVYGNVTLDGSPTQGATVYIIDDTNGDLEATATTDSNGDYSVEVESGITVHVTVRYDDGSTKYTDKSKPFVTV